MGELFAATAVFILAHAIPAWRPIREGLVRRMGEVAYVIAYTALTLAIVVWLGIAYARAPYIEVWPFATSLRWVPLAVMPFACILLVAGLSAPNPLSVGAGSKGYDPVRPGIVTITRHPLMWAFILWAAAHLAPNGDLASILLFGLLLGLGSMGPASLDAKRRRHLGEEEWLRLAIGTSNIPFAAVLAGRARLHGTGIGLWRLLGGLALYGLILWGHEAAIGVSPYPF
ncbi:MAG: NnrU family protein [Magnetospirillum sp. WYHS-4]